MDWGSVPDWIVALTTLFGVAAGLYQLSAIRRANHQSTQFERAKLLLEFDRDFESPAMTASRQKLLALRNRFESEVAGAERQMTAVQQITEVARLMSQHMTTVWQKSRRYDGDPTADKDSSADEYKLMMQLPYWCETLGHQSRRNLLPLDDVLDLYDQLIINTIGNMLTHIKLRQEHGPHKNARFLENAAWLYDQSLRYKKAIADPPPPAPVSSRVKWR